MQLIDLKNEVKDNEIVYKKMHVIDSKKYQTLTKKNVNYQPNMQVIVPKNVSHQPK